MLASRTESNRDGVVDTGLEAAQGTVLGRVGRAVGRPDEVAHIEVPGPRSGEDWQNIRCSSFWCPF
jgi:hypothetical protein